MAVAHEKEKRTYALSGNTVGATAGDRMKLQGKKAKPKAPDKTLVGEAREVTKDFDSLSAAAELPSDLRDVEAVDSVGETTRRKVRQVNSTKCRLPLGRRPHRRSRLSASFSSGNLRAIVIEIGVVPACAVSAPRSIAVGVAALV
jgi:hypothetical protein